MAKPSSFYLFMLFAGIRFHRLQIWRLHVFASIGLVIGAMIGWNLTHDMRALGINLAVGAGVNLLITISHYAASYYWWRKKDAGA